MGHDLLAQQSEPARVPNPNAGYLHTFCVHALWYVDCEVERFTEETIAAQGILHWNGKNKPWKARGGRHRSRATPSISFAAFFRVLTTDRVRWQAAVGVGRRVLPRGLDRLPRRLPERGGAPPVPPRARKPDRCFLARRVFSVLFSADCLTVV